MAAQTKVINFEINLYPIGNKKPFNALKVSSFSGFGLHLVPPLRSLFAFQNRQFRMEAPK